LQVLACAAVLLLADWAYRHVDSSSFFPGAPLDETAHFLTALLLLQLLPAAQRARIAAPALFASVAIDLDHVPQYLGHHFLTVGTPRPYTHSLLTIVVLLALALGARRRRRLFAGLALGVVLHFFRDMGEGSGSAVSLLWPLSDHGYSYAHATYVALMAGAVAAEICAGLLSPRMRVGLPWRARRRQASRASA
jgi:inner membrane protein